MGEFASHMGEFASHMGEFASHMGEFASHEKSYPQPQNLISSGIDIVSSGIDIVSSGKKISNRGDNIININNNIKYCVRKLFNLVDNFFLRGNAPLFSLPFGREKTRAPPPSRLSAQKESCADAQRAAYAAINAGALPPHPPNFPEG